jgi:hypothetical protein
MRLLGRSILILFLANSISRGWAESVVWQRQFGSESSDSSSAVAADALGNVFVSAQTFGSIGGPNAGANADIVLRLYDAAGNVQWTRQLGTPNYDSTHGLTTDGFGNVYITGGTGGNLFGTGAGDQDAFVSKYNSAGALVWSRQFGTPDFDAASGVSFDRLGHIYVAGSTDDALAGSGATGYAYVRKYDTDGNLLWTSQFGDPQQFGVDEISADTLGNVFAIGYGTADTTNSGWYDGFINKLDANGNVVWKHQFGVGINTYSSGVAADGLGNAYVSGFTYPDLDAYLAGDADAFVTKYDASGNKLWTRTIGDIYPDFGYNVATDGHGNVYLVGTLSSLPHNPGQYDFPNDAFVSKFDADGDLIWTHTFLGTASAALSISADGLGNVFFSGHTTGEFAGTVSGPGDAIVARISDVDVPEPTIFSLAMTSVVGLCAANKRGRRVSSQK